MSHIKRTVIQDLLPSHIDRTCSKDTAQLVEDRPQSCPNCKGQCEEMSTGSDAKYSAPELNCSNASYSLQASLIWIAAALVITIGCYLFNIGGAWYGGPANIGQFIATLLYVVFWCLFTVAARKCGVLAKISFIISLLTFIAAANSLIVRLLGAGGFLSAFVSVFASVPFYGLRMLTNWTALYAVTTGFSLLWLLCAIRNLILRKKNSMFVE